MTNSQWPETSATMLDCSSVWRGTARARTASPTAAPARPAACCAIEQLAGQRESRQGAPSPVADQAEIWPQDFLGRPDHSHRQRCPGVDRFCGRPRSGGRADVWEPEELYWGREGMWLGDAWR